MRGESLEDGQNIVHLKDTEKTRESRSGAGTGEFLDHVQHFIFIQSVMRS